MFGLRRRRQLPAQQRSKLSRDERVVAWAAASGSSGLEPEAVVVTTLGVWLPGRSDRLGWHQVHKASWSGTVLAVIPAEPHTEELRTAEERTAQERTAEERTAEERTAEEGEVAAGEVAAGGVAERTAEEPATERTAAAGTDYAVMRDGMPVTVSLRDPGDVPDEIRKRVTRSVVYSTHHAVPGGGVRVVARRVAGRDGVVWHVRYDDGTDPDAPEVIAATGVLVADAAEPFAAQI